MTVLSTPSNATPLSRRKGKPLRQLGRLGQHAVGIFFGFYPARRLDPIEALRYE